MDNKNTKPPIPEDQLGHMQWLTLNWQELRKKKSTACTLPASDEGHSVASSGSCSVE